MRRAAEGPDLAIAQLDEPVNAFPERLAAGSRDGGGLIAATVPLTRSTRVTRPPHSPRSAPSQTLPARSSRKVVASSSSANGLSRGEVMDDRIGHVPASAVAITGLVGRVTTTRPAGRFPLAFLQPTHRGRRRA